MALIPGRRLFLRDGLIVMAGACTFFRTPGLVVSGLGTLARGDPASGPGFDRKLRELGIELPPPTKPVAVYVPAVVTGSLLFTSGHVPRTAEGARQQGRVGTDLTLPQGAEAARRVGLHILSTVRHTLGTLDRVVRLVKVLGMVNCTPDFTGHPQVINGFSDLMVQVFGEQAGTGARSAVGMRSLPGNAPVEIEAIFEINPAGA